MEINEAQEKRIRRLVRLWHETENPRKFFHSDQSREAAMQDLLRYVTKLMNFRRAKRPKETGITS